MSIKIRLDVLIRIIAIRDVAIASTGKREIFLTATSKMLRGTR